MIASSHRLVLAAVLGALVACNGGGDGDGPPSRIRWAYQGAPDYYASAALSLDGKTVYFATSMESEPPPAPRYTFRALSAADGAVRWSYSLGTGELRAPPAVAPDGSITLVVETEDFPVTDVVHRLSAEGALLWTFDVNPSGWGTIGVSAPAIGEDGTVYAAGDQLYAISAAGALRWTVPPPVAGEALGSSPVIGKDGTVYFAAHNMALAAYDPSDGTVRWTWPITWPDFVFASPAIGADGTIYVATDDGVLRAVTPAGAIAWEFDVRSVGFVGSLRSSPAVGADGSLYFGSSQGTSLPTFFSLTADGGLRWMFVPDDIPPDLPISHCDIYSSPALGADGTVYFGHEFGRVYALDAADGTVRWVQETAAGITYSSAALATDGTLFIGDLSGAHYAIDTEGPGLDGGAPWPKYRGDLQNSGRKP